MSLFTNLNDIKNRLIISDAYIQREIIFNIIYFYQPELCNNILYYFFDIFFTSNLF